MVFGINKRFAEELGENVSVQLHFSSPDGPDKFITEDVDFLDEAEEVSPKDMNSAVWLYVKDDDDMARLDDLCYLRVSNGEDTEPIMVPGPSLYRKFSKKIAATAPDILPTRVPVVVRNNIKNCFEAPYSLIEVHETMKDEEICYPNINARVSPCYDNVSLGYKLADGWVEIATEIDDSLTNGEIILCAPNSEEIGNMVNHVSQISVSIKDNGSDKYFDYGRADVTGIGYAMRKHDFKTTLIERKGDVLQNNFATYLG